MIPITGMEGIGKTTLAKLIFNHKAVIGHFLFALWTSDGCQFHLRHKDKITEYDLSQVGYAWSYNIDMRLPPNLKMKSDPHLLRLRTDEEIWALFTYALKMGIPPELLKLKEDIVKRYGGYHLLGNFKKSTILEISIKERKIILHYPRNTFHHLFIKYK